MEQEGTNEKTNRLDPLDALRAFAIFLIFALHAAIMVELPPTTSNFIFYTPAWAGVWMLFVLSGYLIGKGFRTDRYKSKIEYVKKRFVRICVPYYVFMFTLLLLLHPGLPVNDPITFLRILTFTYNGIPRGIGYGGMWFVSTLMQFYIISLFFEILVRKIGKNRHACTVLFVVILVSGLLLRQFLYMSLIEFPSDIWSNWIKYVYTLSLTNLDLFFCGFLLSWIMINERGQRYNPQPERRTAVLTPVVILALLSMVVFFAYCQALEPIDSGRSVFYMYRGQTLTILVTCLYIYCLDRSVRQHNERLSLSAVKKNPFRIVECFAAISLGFYFWHPIVLNRTVFVLQPQHTLGDHLITMAIAGILTVLMATIFYYSVEKWSARILRKSKD